MRKEVLNTESVIRHISLMNIFHAEETSLIIAQNENVHVRVTFYSYLSLTSYSMVGVPVKRVFNTQLSVCTNSWLQVFRLLDQDDLMESRTHFTYTQHPVNCWANRGAANQRKTALKEEIKSFIPSFNPFNGKEQLNICFFHYKIFFLFTHWQ